MEVGDDVDRAVEILGAGGLVALPTETVYGLAADATKDDAVRRIYAVKGRPAGHPLIVHVADVDRLPRWASRVPDAAALLAEACWPGPLTVIVPAATSVSRVVTGGRDTVGVRVPAHPLALAVLERMDGVAAPSANRFGRVSPTSAAHVVADLGDDVDYVLDGGPSPVGVESTIVDTTTDPPQVLRPGGIADEEVARLLGAPLGEASGPSRAPGMLAGHYAPSAPVLLVESVEQAERAAAGRRARVLHDDDLVRYAQRLYADLRDADESGAEIIVA